jgi:hypothetical protein
MVIVFSALAITTSGIRAALSSGAEERSLLWSLKGCCQRSLLWSVLSLLLKAPSAGERRRRSLLQVACYSVDFGIHCPWYSHEFESEHWERAGAAIQLTYARVIPFKQRWKILLKGLKGAGYTFEVTLGLYFSSSAPRISSKERSQRFER